MAMAVTPATAMVVTVGRVAMATEDMVATAVIQVMAMVMA